MDQNLGQKFFIVLAIISSIGIAIEYVYSSFKNKKWYGFSEFLTNMFISSGHLYWGLLTTPIIFGGYQFIHQKLGYQSLKSSLGVVSYYILGYLLTEFIQYWGHRLSHRQNILIAGHIVHHSSKEYNLSTALRVSWIYRSYIWFMYIPLALMGYNAIDFFIFQVIMNGYNFFMHTRAHINYGVLKKIFVTPEHHRLHHCSNKEYYGSNFGASLIIFDRLFGTCRETIEGVQESYGLKRNIESADPVFVNFHYFGEVYKNAKQKGRGVISSFLGKAEPLQALEYKKSQSSSGFLWKYFIIYLSLLGAGLFIGQYKAQIPLIIKILIVVSVTWLLSVCGRRLSRISQDQAS